MTTKPKRSRIRHFAQNLLLFAIVSFVCLLVLELVVRHQMPMFSPAGQIGFVLNTNGLGLGPANGSFRQATPKGDFDLTVRFNEYGFRDTKDLRLATDQDWFVLGDSYSFGWGVDEEKRYSNVLEQKLAGQTSGSHIFNIALPENIIGYQRLLCYAQSCGARVNRLIVGVCMENDLRDYSDGKSGWDLDLQPKKATTQISAKEKVRGWLKRSALYNATSYGLQRFDAFRRFFEKIGVARNIIQLSGKNEWNEAALRSSRDELAKLVSGRQALILIIPSRRLWHGDNIETEKKVHETFLRLLDEANLRVVDVRPALEKTREPLAHYFKTDPHWNVRGHALAAEELFRAMADSR